MGQQRIHKERPKRRVPMPPPTQVEEDKRTRLQAEAIRKEIDEVLADIDDVLEENAQEFVNAYVQKGGE